ncbi:serine/threonine-protein kinase [Streptomyces sp. NPDC050504]|uniref:serine/threonine-protein kinase n=1 Tax=Streptomyces sp. NPDC050504 TaxID=3365618 RepID=UPI00379AED61
MVALLPNDPQEMGPYRLTARLGSGGMGIVYLGRSRTGREVAVKVVRAELADEPGFRDRFRREVGLAMRVGGFWTAAVVDTDADCPTPWVASQYVAGPSLADAVHDRGPLPEAAVRFLGAGLAEALTAIHAIGLVHRDVKPANVLLAHDGPRVIDFGVSKALDSATGLTRTGTTLGTPGFMSPEQATGEGIGAPSDVFSLGSVLAFAVSGRGPFGDGPTHALLYRVVHRDPDLSEVPGALRPLVEGCLAKEPGERPTAEEVLDRLAVRAGDGPPEGWPGKGARPAAPATLKAESIPHPSRPTRPAPPTPPPPQSPPGTTPHGATFRAGGRFTDFRRSWGPYWKTALLTFLTAVVVEAAGGPAVAKPGLAAAAAAILLGLVVSAAHLAEHALRLDGTGLELRRAGRTLHARWQDVAYATLLFTDERTLAVVLVLRAESRIPIPRPLRGRNSGNARECVYRVDLKSPTQAAIQSTQLDTHLRRYAGPLYAPTHSRRAR